MPIYRPCGVVDSAKKGISDKKKVCGFISSLAKESPNEAGLVKTYGGGVRHMAAGRMGRLAGSKVLSEYYPKKKIFFFSEYYPKKIFFFSSPYPKDIRKPKSQKKRYPKTERKVAKSHADV